MLGGVHYLTVSDDEKSLIVSKEEKASGLTINANGTFSLAGAATETVYMPIINGGNEPEPGQQFTITKEKPGTVFCFAEIQEEKEDPKPADDVLFPVLLPQKNFQAEVVSPDKVYGDDQYVIFTAKAGKYAAITSGAECSSPLILSEEPAVGVKLTSPDQNVLWTVNNNRTKPVEGNYYKYIRSCASNAYLAAKDTLLDENIKCDFFLSDKDGKSALLKTEDGRYVTLNGDKFAITDKKALASRFYFAKVLQKEQQVSGNTAAIPKGNLLRLVDWNSISEDKTYAIISATEFNRLHYALSGNGRFARYGADNLTNNSLCPNDDINGVYYGQPCKAKVGDIFYTNGQNILWNVSVSGKNKAVFQNAGTKLYLKPSDGVAAQQTPSISEEFAEITIEPVDGQAYAYLSNGSGKYLGIWQYILVGVSESDVERGAYYLAEVLNSDKIEDLPATAVQKDSDKNTVSFGGLYSVYQGSQHLLNDGTGVESYILMKDGDGTFKPNSSQYGADNKNNYFVTYCGDYEANMPTFTEPGKFKAVSLDDYDGFDSVQKASLKTIISHSYPYVSTEEFLYEMKEAGFEVSADCGTDEIMAGTQAAIYTFTNPRDDGKEWGYESSDGWAHNSYEVNKPKSYVSNHRQAEKDVNAVRDYLCNLAAPVSAASAGRGEIEVTDREYFAITTEIEGKTYALSMRRLIYPGWRPFYVEFTPYDPDDISQLWYADEKGYIRWFPTSFNQEMYENEKDSQKYLTAYFHLDKNNMVNTHLDLEFRNYYYLNDSGNNICDGVMPIKIEKTADGKSYLGLFDPENTLQQKVLNKFDLNGYNYLSGIEFDGETKKSLNANKILNTPDNDTQQFNKLVVTPVIPKAIAYDLEDLKWSVQYNEDETAYGVTVKGKLNEPIRQKYDDVKVYMYCNDELLGELQFEDDQQTFTVSSDKVIPDDMEAHFWIRIRQKCMDITVFEPMGESGWQLQLGSNYAIAEKQIHEDTTSISVEKIWGDDKDHSGDTVKFSLLENGTETGLTTAIDAAGGWKGAFKHVPNKRWTYSVYGETDEEPAQGEIPILTHKYTMKEIDVKDGYTPVYDFGDSEKEEDKDEIKKLDPGEPYYVQAVLRTEDKGDLAVELGNDDLYSEYVKGKESQKFFLNGNGTLLMQIKYEDYGVIFYQEVHMEPAADSGKYYLYIEGGGIKQYLPAELPADSEDPGAYSKKNAAVIELVDATTGETVVQMPEDAFLPVKTALEFYLDGTATDKVVDFEKGFVDYVPEDKSQTFTIYRHGEQFIFFPNVNYSSRYYILEPCSEEGQYAIGELYGDELLYLSMDGVTEDKEEAMHFGLKGAAHVSIDQPQSFKVTNNPNPQPPQTDPTDPDDPVSPDKPTNPDKPAKSDNQAKPNDTVSDEISKTGDSSSNAVPWLAAMGISVAGLIGLIFAKKKKSAENIN